MVWWIQNIKWWNRNTKVYLFTIIICLIVIVKGEFINVQSVREPEKCLFAHNHIRKVWHDTNELKWDDELAYGATKWATHLAIKNDLRHSDMNNYGENIFRMSGDTSLRCIDAVHEWYKERLSSLYNFDDVKFDPKAGHMLQLLWKTAKNVGVGIVTAHGNIWIVARYTPAQKVETSYKDYIKKPVKDGFPQKHELISNKNHQTLHSSITFEISKACNDVKDNWSFCKESVSDCNDNPTFRKNCASTCGTSSECSQTENDNWTEWVKVSHCLADCRYRVERYCINSSKDGEANSCPGRNTNYVDCTDCKCEDVDPNCVEEKAIGRCELSAEWAKIKCRKTCGFCSKEEL